MRIPTHRLSGRADWKTIPDAEMNRWQGLAKRTGGLLAPANLISLIGATMVLYGLILVAERELSGTLWILAGRLADVADGYIAHTTGTKSLFGEALDATIDKLLLFAVLVVAWTSELVPVWMIAVLLILGSFNSLVSLWAKWKRRTLHPVRAGKYSTAFAWTALIAFPAAELFGGPENTPKLALLIAGSLSFALSVALGIVSSADYFRQLRSSHVR